MSPVRTENGFAEFPQVSLTTLVDSPLLSGKYFRTLELSSTPPVFVDIAADVPEALDVSPEWEARLRRLITEARALFGGFHFEQYRFLLAFSEELGNDGIEHHQSSDDRLGARLFSDEAFRLGYGYLLPHEFAHSWNGKYRRPLGLATRNFQEPQLGDLLWVYEGLTRIVFRTSSLGGRWWHGQAARTPSRSCDPQAHCSGNGRSTPGLGELVLLLWRRHRGNDFFSLES
jgi:predicted metalloprotease with PDZ domain